MSKTLVVKMSQMEQYDPTNRRIIWEDANIGRWQNTYSKMNIGDYVIFNTNRKKFLVGSISELNTNTNIHCINIEEINIENDNFLRINASYPESINRLKATFAPFIHPKDINIDEIIREANQNNLINFYIFRDESSFNKSKEFLKINDRITLLNNGKFSEIKIYDGETLTLAPTYINERFRVFDLSIDEMIEINRKTIRKNSIRKTNRSNNVERLKLIQKELINNGFFKFNTFFTYNDTLLNNLVYKDVKNKILSEISLLENENVYKISMSPKDINDDIYEMFLQQGFIVVHRDTLKMAGSSLSQGQIFSAEIKINDYFYLSRGNKYFELIGKITSDAEPCSNSEWRNKGWVQRSFEIIKESFSDNQYKNVKKWWTPNFNSTCIQIPKNEIVLANSLIFEPFFGIKFTQGLPPIKNNNQMNNQNNSLNQILYGPPGTGKTYNSINKAISITNPAFANWQKREDVKNEYDRLVKDNKILFTTFHQSMSYEDFIEGIKPNQIENRDTLSYEIKAGIFKIACARAAYLCHKKHIQAKGGSMATYKFDDLYNSFIESIKPSIRNNQYPTYKTITGKDVEIFEVNSQGSIRARAKGSKATQVAPLTQENIEKLYNKYKNISDIDNLSQIREAVQVSPRSTEFYAVFGGIKKFEENYMPDNTIDEEEVSIDTMEDEDKVKKFTAGIYNDAIIQFGKEAEAVVLILDEINRGNVSQIFGELITLIEDDKRIGRPECLEVILPYSKSKFAIPPNLFLVGTMNTADRSVEALDTALRRRFAFEELPPKYDLNELQYSYGGVKGHEILQTINKRIEKLLDKDHLIGHSYFILKNSENVEIKLKNSFYKNIIPLLQEYFFGDFGKIGLVLGQGFVNLKNWDEKSDSFAEFDHESSGDFESKSIYQIIDYRAPSDYEINKVKMNFEKAIKLLMKIDIA